LVGAGKSELVQEESLAQLDQEEHSEERAAQIEV
jgi:hypothetical protein